jgi:multidrug efflux system membrane fusion protein
MQRTALIAVAVLAAIVFGAGCASEATVEKPARPAIVAQPAGAAQAIETYAGEVRARYESALGFRIAGKIQRRLVDVGARVAKGDVLAVLEPEDVELQAASARAQVAWAKADLALAQAELERHASMLEKHYISQALYDARKNAHEAAAAKLTQAQAQLRVAQNQAEYTELRADADGVITAIAAEIGQVVAAGQPIATLAHDGDLEVLISVPENRVTEFATEQPVLVEIWAKDNARVDGKVREIAPEADPRTRTYDVRVTLTGEAPAVQLGMTARVYLDAGADATTLLVPLTALHAKNGQPALWVVDPRTHQVRLAPVTVGQYREEGVAITGGLSPAQWIVTVGVQKLAEGQVVRPVDAANRPLKIDA